ncbi:hypothetical protein scyTo_0024598, partial [Scyliorhinus torazame]|nr:hypothetical protein [Scyliorhinus torazame]
RRGRDSFRVEIRYIQVIEMLIDYVASGKFRQREISAYLMRYPNRSP